MKKWVACASALVLISACSASKEATAALEAMNLEAETSSPVISYKGKSGSGDNVTLNDVVIGGGTGNGVTARSMTFGGLDVTESGAPVVSSITLKGISPESGLPEGTTLVLDSISVEGLNDVAGQFLASAFTDAGPGTPPPFEQWEFSRVSINGLNLTGDFSGMGAPAESAGKFNVALGEFSVSDLSKEIFGKAHLSGFKGDFDVPAEMGGMPIVGKFDFGTADINNIRGGIFADAIQAGMNSAFDETAMATVQADLMASFTSPLEPGYDSFTWSGLNAEASGVKFVVSKLEQKATRNAEGVVTALATPRGTMTFSADSSAGVLGQQAAMGLGMVGYPSNVVQLYGESEATFDPATDTTRYSGATFGVTDVVDVKIDGGFQGMKEAIAALMTSMSAFDQSMAGMGGAPAMPDMSGLENLKVIDLDVTITDKSLVNFLLGLGGMFGGGDPATLRADVVNMLSSMGADLAGAGIDPSVSTELSAALAEFVKQPGALNIRLKPAEPVALGAASAPLTKQQLGFSASFAPSPATAPAPN